MADKTNAATPILATKITATRSAGKGRTFMVIERSLVPGEVLEVVAAGVQAALELALPMPDPNEKIERLGSDYAKGWDAGVREAIRRVLALPNPDHTTGEAVRAIRALLPPFEPVKAKIIDELLQSDIGSPIWSRRPF